MDHDAEDKALHLDSIPVELLTSVDEGDVNGLELSSIFAGDLSRSGGLQNSSAEGVVLYMPLSVFSRLSPPHHESQCAESGVDKPDFHVEVVLPSQIDTGCDGVSESAMRPCYCFDSTFLVVEGVQILLLTSLVKRQCFVRRVP